MQCNAGRCRWGCSEEGCLGRGSESGGMLAASAHSPGGCLQHGSGSPTVSACPQLADPRRTAGSSPRHRPQPLDVTWGGQWHRNGKGTVQEPLPASSSPHRGVLARFTKPQHSQRLGAAGTLCLPTARKGFHPSLQGAGGCEAHPSPGPRCSGAGDACLQEPCVCRAPGKFGP